MFQIYRNSHVITQQPQAGLTEKLQWASRVSTAYRGDESRKSLRCNPEVTLTMTHRVAQRDRTKVQALINAEKIGIRRIEWWCPLWHLAVHLEGISPRYTVTDPMEHGFQDDGYCIIYNPLSIENATPTTYVRTNNLVALGAESPFEKFAVAVLRKANLVGERGLAGMMGDDELNVSFRLVDPLKVDKTVINPEDRFDNLDVLSIPSEEQNPDETDEQEQIVSFQTGKHDVIRRRDQPISVSSLRWVGQWDDEVDHGNVAQFRRWLWKREGRTIAFLHPSFNDDLIFDKGVSGTTITLFLGLDEVTRNHLDKVSPYIALFVDDRVKSYHTVVSIAPALPSDATMLTVTPSINSANYSYGSLVFPMRLREDSVTFEWDNDRFVSANIGLQGFYTSKADGVVKGTSAC